MDLVPEGGMIAVYILLAQAGGAVVLWLLNRDKDRAATAKMWAEASATYTKSITQLTGTVAGMVAKLDERDERLDKLEAAVRVRDRRLETLEHELKERDQKIAALVEQVAALESAAKEKDAKISAMQSEIDELKNARERDNEELKRVQAERDSLKAQLEAHQNGEPAGNSGKHMVEESVIE